MNGGDDRPTEDRSTEDRPTEDRPTEDRPAEDRPVLGDGPRESGPGWHPVARTLFYCGTLLLILNLASLVVLSVYLMFRGDGGDLATRLQELSEEPSAGLLLGAYVVVAPAAFLWTTFFRRKFDQRSVVSLGFRAPRAGRSVVTGAAIGLVAPAIVVISGLATGVYGLGGTAPLDSSGESITRSSPVHASPADLLWYLVLFAGFILQSATEELVLRGYVQRNMVEWKAATRNLVWILIVPALLFSLFHGFNPDYGAVAAINTVLIGVLFGAIVLGSGHLWSVIGLHAGWNFGLACIWSLPVSGLTTARLLEMEIRDTGGAGRFLFGGGYGPEGGLLVTLLVLGGLFWALPRAMDAWLVDRWGTDPEPRLPTGSA